MGVYGKRLTFGAGCWRNSSTLSPDAFLSFFSLKSFHLFHHSSFECTLLLRKSLGTGEVAQLWNLSFTFPPLSLLSCTLTHLSHKWPNTLPELRFLLLFQMVRNGRMRDLRGHTSVVNVASLGFGLSSRKMRKCEAQGKMLMQLKLQHLK